MGYFQPILYDFLLDKVAMKILNGDKILIEKE